MKDNKKNLMVLVTEYQHVRDNIDRRIRMFELTSEKNHEVGYFK